MKTIPFLLIIVRFSLAFIIPLIGLIDKENTRVLIIILT